MADINTIVNLDSYKGNPLAGGGFYQGITIDPSPIEKLAAFTYYRDQNLWQQKQINDKAAAKEIADMTAFDVLSPMKGYSEYLKGKVGEIKDFLASNPNALSYSKDPKGFQKFKELEGQFQQARTAANTSEVIYNARKSAADKEADLIKKQLSLDNLDADVEDLFAAGIDGALNNSLKSTPELKARDYEVPKVATALTEYIVQDPNDNKKYTIKSIDIDKLGGDSYLAWVGANQSALDENSPEFKKMSPKRQELARREAALVSDKMKGVSNITTSLNALIDQKKQADPNFKPSAITGNFTGDTLLDTVKSLNQTNAKIRELNNLIKQGSLRDKSGIVVTREFPEINVDDGISPAELIMQQAISAHGGSLFSLEKDIQLTDNAIQLKLERMQQAGANYRASLSGDKTPTTEGRNFMDLTGYTGTLTTADIAAIDPTLVQSESGVFKLTSAGAKATFNILPNGDVEVHYNDKTTTKPETVKVINKSKYQKEAVTVTQTVLKDRKGEQGNPFTFTGLDPTKPTETPEQRAKRIANEK